jgi:hypothetical protein
MNNARRSTLILPEVPIDPFAHLTHAKQRAFLRTLADIGRHTRACRVAEISHTNPWYWRRTDARFAALERQAWDLWVRKVVAAARASLLREM